MKTTPFLLLGLILPLAWIPASAQDTATTDVSRTNFADRSDQQLRTLRREIEQHAQQTPLASQTALAPIMTALTEAENALAQFKTASTFDQAARKADFEAALTRVTERWNDFKAASNPVSPVQPVTPAPAPTPEPSPGM